MWQYIIVYIIGAITAIYLLKKSYQFFFSRKTPINRCAGCPGCSLKVKS